MTPPRERKYQYRLERNGVQRSDAFVWAFSEALAREKVERRVACLGKHWRVVSVALVDEQAVAV